MNTIKAIADQWAGKSCYLDGKPAKVTGRLKKFATIAALDSAISVQFSWFTVNHVMRSGGFFETK